MSKKIVTGIFREEVKNRFRCIVEIDGYNQLCYVPSSCRLSNLIDLQDKEVLLTPIKQRKTGISYSLYALNYNGNYIVLNLSEANRVLEANIKSRRFSYLGSRKQILREKIVNGYKTDLYIEDTDTVIEVKTVLSPSTNSKFLSVYSERAERQLDALNSLLQSGKKVCYVIIAMNPKTKKITIDKAQSIIYNKLSKCIVNGMVLKAYSVRLKDTNIYINKEIEVALG